MAFARGRWVALLVGSAAVFAGGHAMAADGALPHGIHLGKNGRYYQDICDHSAHRHCYAARLLPPGYRPVPFPAEQTFCGLQNGSQPGTELTPPTGSLGPAEVQAAYTIPPSTAAHGKIVAVIDYPDVTASQDLATYRAGYPSLGTLPACANGLPDGTTPCFASVDQSGNPYTATSTSDCPGADPETSLDMEMISAACPDCSILLIEMTNASKTDGPTDQDFITSAAVAAKLGAVATSISFGGPEQIDGPDPTGSQYTTAGHLVLAASGDTGYLLEAEPGGGTSPSYPASAVDVLGVGGTTLEGSVGTSFTEIVWNDANGAGGSGCSTEFAMPSFQTTFGASKFGTCTMRASVDLSAAAEYAPPNALKMEGGIAEYDSYNEWIQVVGTSAASPMVASILVRLGLAESVASDLGFVYTHIANFNDVTSGTNDGSGDPPKTLCTAGDVLCTAGPGWDGPTGVGTPNGSKLSGIGVTTSEDAGGGTDSGATTDGGGTVIPDDAGSTGGGNNLFGITPNPSGCSCTTPGSAPVENAGALAALGALALFGARRRRR